MRWTAKKLRQLKNSALAVGAIIILLYLILGLIESRSKLITFIILLPVLAWPYIAYKYEKQAAIMAIVIGSILILWFIIDFFVLRIQRQYWHIPVFILIAPLPAFVLAWMLLRYDELKHPKKKK